MNTITILDEIDSAISSNSVRYNITISESKKTMFITIKLESEIITLDLSKLYSINECPFADWTEPCMKGFTRLIEIFCRNINDIKIDKLFSSNTILKVVETDKYITIYINGVHSFEGPILTRKIQCRNYISTEVISCVPRSIRGIITQRTELIGVI